MKMGNEMNSEVSRGLEAEEMHSMIIDSMMAQDLGRKLIHLLSFMFHEYDLTGKIFFNGHDSEDPFKVNILILELDISMHPTLMKKLNKVLSDLGLKGIVHFPSGRHWFEQCAAIPQNVLLDDEAGRIFSGLPGGGAA